jgi:hypothetical protein
VAATRPGLVRGLVIAPPLPGIGARILGADAQREFWYQSFHRLDDFFDDAALRLLPSAGHFAPLEAPDEFAAEILAAAGLAGHGMQ